MLKGLSMGIYGNGWSWLFTRENVSGRAKDNISLFLKQYSIVPIVSLLFFFNFREAEKF